MSLRSAGPPPPPGCWPHHGGPVGRDRPEEGPVGGAAGNDDVDWNEGVNVPGQKLDRRGN